MFFFFRQMSMSNVKGPIGKCLDMTFDMSHMSHSIVQANVDRHVIYVYAYSSKISNALRAGHLPNSAFVVTQLESGFDIIRQA